ncbi:MAG: acetoin utilization protein AcuC [Lentisphaerae bacterium]|jgi:acetoin utilization protein AcuC|nr:acetoin utilization protein AcuC [Lentisphaerota bacterium]MBT4820303.1 acetoin utilization protein AcuC [Lentisphaerota bacterium]MBT5604770.1 acetoin utilization protein AcuC [Lentisphaerota bacterium]MBT7053902.1 acetoin utilization protein AcuC [Lentisphaerota bacterium]MBT7842824.1 acetoin utilization protein AcuC [Lentisphaerota bacterium]
MAPKKVFIHSPELDLYPYPPECPFNTSRAGRTHGIAKSMGLLAGADRSVISAPPAERNVLEMYHTADYLDALASAPERQIDQRLFDMGLGTMDCPVFPGVYEANALACGGTVKGAQLIADREATVVFHPAGGLHHAFPDRAAGFCYMNDIVLACMVLADAGRRVLFLDVDVHHTDGVQEAFYAREDVLTISMHESGRTLFPGTGFEGDIGVGSGEGYTVNLPFPADTYDDIYLEAFMEVVVPLVEAFEPDVLVVEAGADALAGDPLAHLCLTNNVYVDIIEALLAAGKPMLVTGGGGYNIENTVRAWALLWSCLCGDRGHDDMMAGMGGVMLGSTDWHGGLRDRLLAPSPETREVVAADVGAMVEKVKQNVFPRHGL